MTDINDGDLLDCTDTDSEDEGKPSYGPLHWPWFVLLGLLTIGVVAIGAMVVG